MDDEVFCHLCGDGPLRMLTDYEEDDVVECSDCSHQAFLEKRKALREKWRTEAKQRYDERRQTHTVYRYTFAEDGAQYVGVTSDTLNRRERAHQRDCSVLGRRLDQGQEHDRETLAVFSDRDEAEDYEKEMIAAIPVRRRLNLLTPLEDWEKQTSRRAAE